MEFLTSVSASHSYIRWPTTPRWRQAPWVFGRNEGQEGSWWPLLVLFRWALICVLTRDFSWMGNAFIWLAVSCTSYYSFCRPFLQKPLFPPHFCSQKASIGIHIIVYLYCMFSLPLVTIIILIHQREKHWKHFFHIVAIFVFIANRLGISFLWIEMHDHQFIYIYHYSSTTWCLKIQKWNKLPKAQLGPLGWMSSAVLHLFKSVLDKKYTRPCCESRA